MQNPTVSVIVPNYNHSRFLPKRLESIYGQTFQDFEVILLDDASIDDSLAILEQYAQHPKTKCLLINETNSGAPFMQWQKGMEAASGEWIWVAESDDYCQPDFLETLLKGMNSKNCVLGFQEAIWIDENGLQLKAPYQYPSFSMPGSEFISRYMLNENRLVNAGQLILKRSALCGISSKWQACLRAGDYRLFCEILSKGIMYATGVPRAFFLRHLNALSLNSRSDDRAITERNETWQWLHETGIVSTAQFTRVFTAQLAGLETVRKGMPANDYEIEKIRLYQLAKTMGVRVNNWQVLLESFIRKARHWRHSN